MEEEPLKKAYQKRGLKFWESTVEKQQQSGKSQLDFCRETSLSLSTFNQWKRKLKPRVKKSETPPSFLPVILKGSTENSLLSEEKIPIQIIIKESHSLNLSLSLLQLQNLLGL